MNRWYNKQVSIIKENKPQGFFVPIPTAKLKDRIEQLCLEYGIQF
jgi:hypothetical protein